MNLFKQTTLIGIGLIGSSIARALKKKKISKKINIFTRSKRTLNKAKKLKLGNFYTNKIEESVKNSDLIIICTPLSTYGDILNKISKYIDKNAILTDVGSVKLKVTKIFSKLKEKHLNIIPAHPIAGTENSGPDAGFAELFNKRWCVLTPMGRNNKQSLMKMKKLWNQFGSKVQVMNASNHDKILSLTSHMPHLISYSIVSSALNVNNKEKSQIVKFSAGGFRDFTRIAASDAIMWRDIFLDNKTNLLKITKQFEKSLNLIKKYIKENNSKKLYKIFTETKKIRKLIEKEKQD
tara:strand:+ start:10509 stop:11387 length:879 start_codon:yes stop_codon:yes gene_type:complete